MRYRAFISYSHADARWARWLIRALERYRVPARLVGTVGEHGVIGPTLGAFFRDREELTATGDLGATLRAALAQSQALMAIALSLAFTAYVARNDAQRRQAQAEDIVGFMLGDLREKLTTVGRLDLMRTVDDKAAGYFASLDPRDLSDRALEEQARSLTGIGQVRLAEGNHGEAMAAFREALTRSAALHQRAPDDGQRLYDLAQAQFWIGNVAMEQGDYGTSENWLRQYGQE